VQRHARPDKPSRRLRSRRRMGRAHRLRGPAAAACHARHRQRQAAHGQDVSPAGARRAVRGLLLRSHGGTEAESLRQFSAALAEHQGSPVPFSFATWDDAISYLFGLAVPGRGDSPFLVVIDEFPYLAKVAPELPSLIQREIDRFQVDESGMRLLLCGSAMSVMGGLLASTAPLRGRAQLELVVRPFGYRAAADFWGVADEPALAARLHAVVGGTPAYRRQFLADDVPAAWRTSTTGSVGRSSRRSVRSSVRRAICSPRRRTSATPRCTTRYSRRWHRATPHEAASRATSAVSPSTSRIRSTSWRTVTCWHARIGHLPGRKSQYRITEPLINFYEAVMRPFLGAAGERPGRGGLGTVGRALRGAGGRAALRGGVPGVRARAGRSLLSTSLGEVGSGVVTDPKARRQIEIDVAVVEPGSGGSRPAVALLG
jgi:hypothetical protein